MLSGELTGLRARTADDAEILHEELYENVEDWVRGSNLPWVPIASGPGSPYAAPDPADERRGPAPSAAEFSIVELASGELAGQVALWGIDEHNRMAHIGIELRPAFRGRGLGAGRGPRRLPLRVRAPRAAPAAAGDPGRQPRDDRGRGKAGIHPRGSDPRLVLGERPVYGRCHLRVAGGGVHPAECSPIGIDHPQCRICMHKCLRTWASRDSGLCTPQSTVTHSSSHRLRRRCAHPCPHPLWTTPAVHLITATSPFWSARRGR